MHPKNKEVSVARVRKGRDVEDAVRRGRWYGLVGYCKDFGF